MENSALGENASRELGRKALEENAKNHEQSTGHEPWFTLTPAGAAAMRDYFWREAILKDPFRISPETRRHAEMSPTEINGFLHSELGFTIAPRSGQSLSESTYKLLGPVCRSFFHVKGARGGSGNDVVALDPSALTALADQAQKLR